MNLPTPPQEASRDRRRRQNRESQRRWRERYRQGNGDNRMMPQDTPSSRVDDAPMSRTPPPILDAQSPPQSKCSLDSQLDSQHLNGYCFEYTTWVQDQLAGHLDSHIPWPPMDFSFPLQQQSGCCTSTHSQNGELSREGSTNGCLNGLDEVPIHASPESLTSPRIHGQSSHFPPVGTCHPALLTQPAPSSSAGSAAVYQPALSDEAQYRDTETASTAEEAIRDVQLLYRIGVKAGFLKRDDKVKSYLATMKRVYHKVPTLMDEEDYGGPSGSDLDEWSD